MPGIQHQSPLSNALERTASNSSILSRKIRVVFDDPDATDSDSDDVPSRPAIRRRAVHEFTVPPSPKTLTKTNPRTFSRTQSKFRGVRQRPWGRWAAEIRDPIHGVRRWLGTYDTPEAAAAAYNAASVRLQAEKRQLSAANSATESDVLQHKEEAPLEVSGPEMEVKRSLAEIFYESGPAVSDMITGLDFGFDCELGFDKFEEDIVMGGFGGDGGLEIDGFEACSLLESWTEVDNIFAA